MAELVFFSASSQISTACLLLHCMTYTSDALPCLH
jgi:hypothetical protein